MNFYYSSMPADTESVLRTDSLWWTSLDTNRKQVARTFGRNLRDLMALHGITIRQMADWLSVSPSLVEAWRQGQSKPNYDDARAVSDYFAVSLDELVRPHAFPTYTDQETLFSKKIA